ncbi:hypothetical protein AB835_11170 [Candidatus Endobugula sertula]|uniref:Flagellar hook-length control protein-like C-terminal domain-containing protein n=1 Tax=Candidatus Endobugula sertula TaxID=62101 RepID=A0A1D2QN40_9GAMM|nr:hypothetical protein AB835_11170 [Candidatus Endobugula sertula]
MNGQPFLTADVASLTPAKNTLPSSSQTNDLVNGKGNSVFKESMEEAGPQVDSNVNKIEGDLGNDHPESFQQVVDSTGDGSVIIPENVSAPTLYSEASDVEDILMELGDSGDIVDTASSTIIPNMTGKSVLAAAYRSELPQVAVALATEMNTTALNGLSQVIAPTTVEQEIKLATPIANQLVSQATVTELVQGIKTEIPSAVKIVEQATLESRLIHKSNDVLLPSSITESVVASGRVDLQEAVNVNGTVATTTISQIAKTGAPAALSHMPSISLSIPTSFQQAQWGEAVAEKVMWMSAKGVKEADIQLDPPELGPLIVKVSVSQDQAQVSFSVQHASVREALDQSVMRLREMFADEDINLVDVDVSDHSQSQEKNGESDMVEDEIVSIDEQLAETPLQSTPGQYHLIDSYV